MILGTKSAPIRFQPSTNWTQGGPIVEQEKISLWRYPDLDSWQCTDFDFVRNEGLKAKCYMQGPRPLIAAMRCFTASKLWKNEPSE